MRTGTGLGVIVAAVVLGLGVGCGREYVRKGGPAPHTYRQAAMEFEGVIVENLRGSVDVRISADVLRPVVKARQGYDGGRGDKGPLFAMSTQDMGGKKVMVISGVPNAEKDRKLTLTVTIPAVRSLRVLNGGGRVQVRGLVPEQLEVMSGLSTENGGDIRIEASKALKGSMDLQTSAGSILVLTRTGSAGMIDAKAGDGIEVKALRESVGPWVGTGTSMQGPLGKGSGTWTLRAPKGRVSVQVAD